MGFAAGDAKKGANLFKVYIPVRGVVCFGCLVGDG